MNHIMYMLNLALKKAMAGEKRTYYVGAIGIRSDGTIVSARNGATDIPNRCLHAEYRLARKLDYGAETFVARIRRDGHWGSAKPCDDCHKVMKSRGVIRVYYTIADQQYGVMYL